MKKSTRKASPKAKQDVSRQESLKRQLGKAATLRRIKAAKQRDPFLALRGTITDF